jgi:hypothetical protein
LTKGNGLEVFLRFFDREEVVVGKVQWFFSEE